MRRDEVFGGRQLILPVEAKRRRIDVDAILVHGEPIFCYEDVWHPLPMGSEPGPVWRDRDDFEQRVGENEGFLKDCQFGIPR